MSITLRPYRPADAAEVNAVAIAAFSEFPADAGEWPTTTRATDRMSVLAASAEVIVAVAGERVAGAVAYVGPGLEKQDWFDRDWPVIRMLVVAPAWRGRGVGRALTEECIRRARLDGATLIALHTTPLLERAFGMYERMGFRFLRDSPPVGHVPYAIYVKRLDEGSGRRAR